MTHSYENPWLLRWIIFHKAYTFPLNFRNFTDCIYSPNPKWEHVESTNRPPIFIYQFLCLSFQTNSQGGKTATREDKVSENERVKKRHQNIWVIGDLGKLRMMSPQCTDCAPEGNLPSGASVLCVPHNPWLIQAAGVQRALSVLALSPARSHRELSVNTWLTLEIIGH